MMQLVNEMVAANKSSGSFQLRMIVMFLYIFSFLKLCVGLDSLSPGRPLYGNETLISEGRKFELGFFSPGNSHKSYVGIWYYGVRRYKTIAWVANREQPIRQLANNSRLLLTKDGRLNLYSSVDEIIWNKPLQCSNIDFFNISGVSMPANSQFMNLESGQVCRYACLANCSCSAYAYSNGRCLLWFGDIVDTRVLSSDQNSGGILYIRSSEVLLENKKLSNVLVAAFIIIPLLICISLSYMLWCLWRRKHNKKEAGENIFHHNWEISSKQNTDSASISTSTPPRGDKKVSNLPKFSFSSISAATNNFSSENKLGEGGFGPVYKGNLFGGKSVAVKRLSKRSGQGMEELRNETVLIAKLQHRNLVRLLGCCIEQDEKILIYEYMSNKSLDYFIFDPSKQSLLDWRRRVLIIDGIAQGLLYLHLHSRLRIVHRDLKASNILLDDELNPKIRGVHGAVCGYMSPEYAMEGLFSIKSDVFAFGVLLVEIISGKKNTGFRHSDCLSLLGHAWELWQADRVLELVDSNLDIPSSFVPLRLIHVGLLCVQDSRADRPIMSDVLLMFSNEHSQLVPPKRPAFTSGGSSGFEIDKADNFSVNTLTASVMDGR
ncbi:hypothetical protein ACET3Z_033150 [Daucus carota]